MLPRTNIEIALTKKRDKRLASEGIIKEVHQILNDNERHRDVIKENLRTTHKRGINFLEPSQLSQDRIYHLSDIQKICVDYRLRFLDANFFKGAIPEEAISEIRRLEQCHQVTLDNFKIMAPAHLLKLENADDPLLFIPIQNDNYYLIHKWGRDLQPFRKWLMWPYKNFENLVFTIFILSILLTLITPMQVFTKGEITQSEYILMFLFIFKSVAGLILFYGFSKGKNFNEAIWNSKYYNA